MACFMMLHDTCWGCKFFVSCLQVADLQRLRDTAQSEAAERAQMLARQQQDMALLQVESLQGCLCLSHLKCLSSKT